MECGKVLRYKEEPHQAGFPVRVDSLEDGVHVLRDDLLPGGTKQRAAIRYLESLTDKGYTHFVYASPFCGFAQVALALAALTVKRKLTLMCESDPTSTNEGTPHDFTRLAQNYGAQVFLVPTLNEASEAAHHLGRETGGFVIPLGLNDPSFRSTFQQVVKTVWSKVLTQTKYEVQRVWVPVGSGTLAHCLRQSLPAEVHLCLVDVHVLPSEDERIRQVVQLPNSTYFSVPELFREKATRLPPVPSNLHYDAKLWSFIKNHRSRGDLWWNVAR